MLKQIQGYEGHPEGKDGAVATESSHFSAAQISDLSEDILALRNNPWSLRRVLPLDPNPWIIKISGRCSFFQNEALRNCSAGASQKLSASQKNAPKMIPLGTLQFQ